MNYFAEPEKMPPAQSSGMATYISLPLERWPPWAKLVRLMRIESEPGVGTTTHRVLGERGEKFSKWLKKRGVECGCSARRAAWDHTYRYDDSRPATFAPPAKI